MDSSQDGTVTSGTSANGKTSGTLIWKVPHFDQTIYILVSVYCTSISDVWIDQNKNYNILMEWKNLMSYWNRQWCRRPPHHHQLHPLIPRTQSEDEDNDDFKYSRENLYHIIERGQDALDGILRVAQETDHPRKRILTNEVAGQLLKTNADNAEKLVNLQTTKKSQRRIWT